MTASVIQIFSSRALYQDGVDSNPLKDHTFAFRPHPDMDGGVDDQLLSRHLLLHHFKEHFGEIVQDNLRLVVFTLAALGGLQTGSE